MQQEPVVRLQGVSKIISSRSLVSDLTLDISPGQVFGFLGPNGAGKTTTIRMMVGLMSISQGDIIISGHSVKNEFEQAIAQVGAIVENPEMYKFLTGYQNLVHFARMSPGITKERIAETIERVGLTARIHDKVKTYSLGMRQRLGVAQAILHKPKLLVLDEPTNGLDPQGIRELRDYLRQLCQEEGITVFVSSHLLSEMELMCDTVAIIQNGKLIDVRNLRAEAGADVLTEVAFEVNDAPRAAELISEATVQGNAIVIRLSREQIPDLNARLVSEGFQVYGIRSVTHTLEDQFLQVTGGGSIG
ncbi:MULTISPECIES: ABC transporter ATP-binding protein [Paenibacillus]|uniref:ABC transporter ATP-binding protein n=1 Tax=Paenibacillus TaxID=44249 RepID=UPI0007E33BB1|nr:MULTISPECIES: ABC transporter ATP-binding protein [Paenibacillus]OAX50530.1 putative ABC transporter ATP-binding protein YxlF [Paenibacillus sp. AD87]WDQ34854.1 ABC transporter ATP-binding protein [Paenibacillus marchantiae]SDL25752.1 ABC-2 type transport system ATP-binding protein [Paenibacillus sp. OK060]SEB07241.1 ABC-2 type transport system ATP-binding protein [Paenibacillus sp. 276b]SLK03419.1 ABC-2 type transport system ATP-binding protein [Paenibacillus sp. RU5A]